MRLIDADALKQKWIFRGEAERGYREEIDSAPTIDAKPVIHGEWRSYSPLTDTFECNQCGYQVIDESFRTNFCPYCGADMRG